MGAKRTLEPLQPDPEPRLAFPAVYGPKVRAEQLREAHPAGRAGATKARSRPG